MPDSTNPATATRRGGEGFPQENPDGSPALVGMSDSLRALLIEKANKRNEVVVGGNFADLQRIGEQVVGGPGTSTSNLAQTLPAPPGLDVKEDRVVTAPQAEAARGEWTRETERAGLLDAPPPLNPPENDEPGSVDPTSVSPKAEGGKGASSPSSTSSPVPPKK